MSGRIENVLSERYASPEMEALWSPEGKIGLEREFWIAVMEGQADLGLDIPEEAIEAYRGMAPIIDLGSIAAREKVSKHDVNARIDEFNALAGGLEYIHRGMTSRDLTENVEQQQIRDGLVIVRDRMVSTLGLMARRAAEYSDVVMAGRTHNVVAQPTTLGHRFAMWGQETLLQYLHLEDVLARYPLRGLKGATGSQQDMLQLFKGDANKVDELEQLIADRLGFSNVMGCVGQVYPRSLDLQVVGALELAAAGPSSMATTIRLMAGHDLGTEGFLPGQVGSSAMPHKMNARTCERITGLKKIVAMSVSGAADLSGEQWNEGDVSCSVVRRVVLPDAFLAIDGLFQSTLTVLDGYGAYPAVIQAEFDRFVPFLSTSAVLMGAVQTGRIGRETAHKMIKETAVDVAREIRETGSTVNELWQRLAQNPDFPMSLKEIEAAVGDPMKLTGQAERQTAQFVEAVAPILEAHSTAARYQPEEIL